MENFNELQNFVAYLLELRKRYGDIEVSMNSRKYDQTDGMRIVIGGETMRVEWPWKND